MNPQIRCPVRKKLIYASPEELVRQSLLKDMIETLGYPAECLALEKELKLLPHLSLSTVEIPDRRLDIVCFAKNIHPHHALFPLLVVECKAIPLQPAMLNQVVGYNHFIQAYFISLANQNERRTGWYDIQKKGYVFVKKLPSYQELLASIKG